jgi:[acyl-carrier-protein] S-malonyltransferase
VSQSEKTPKLACIFPGQGSQSTGMGLNLYEQSPAAKKIFDQIDKIAGRSLSNLCFHGSAEELKQTINTQPAILATSLAAWEAYLEAGGAKPTYVAGHSLGEFSALYASAVLSLDAVVKLVEKRAQLMESCPAGAMSAILGMKLDRLKEICSQISASAASEQNVVVVANFNTEEQLVISGSPQSVAAVNEKAKSEGAKVIPLAVGGAFHSPLMEEAATEFNQVLNQYSFADAHCPIIQNATAIAQTNGTIIKNTLAQQMTNSVLWYTSIKLMLDQGVTHFIEIGPGKALSGMIKRIDKTAQIYNLEDSASLNTTLSAIKNLDLAIK